MIKQATTKSETKLISYVVGFALSIILTLNAYYAVTRQLLKGWSLVYLITGFALVQLYVQLVFFLHLNHESKPRLKAVAFWFMLLVVGMLGFGSVWIMHNLNYHHSPLTPVQTENYIKSDEGIKR